MKLPLKYTLFFALACNVSHAVISLGGSTSEWTAILYTSPAQSDFYQDQGTGQGSSDIVGTANGVSPEQAGFYKAYDTKGTESISDDEIGFRVRLGENGGTTYGGVPGYSKYIVIGIDVGGDGAMDIFVAANSQNINYYATGDGANISPNTTSVSELASYSNSVTGQNTVGASLFTYLAVDATTDSTIGAGGDTDLGPANDGTDYFASFKLSMSTIMDAAADSYLISNPGGTPPTLDLTTSLSFLVATSTQPNAYNQDLGGYDNDGGAISKQDETTWVVLGASSDPYTANGESPVPEPSSYALILGVCALGFVAMRRRS